MAMVVKKKRKLQSGIGILSAAGACNILQQSPSCAVTLRSVLKTLLTGGRAAEAFSEDLLANGFLRLVPSILRHPSRKGVAKGVEVLGALSMSSLTAHRDVVRDKDAICALAEILLTRADVELLTVACHAVVDILITPFGCEALRECGVMNHLLNDAMDRLLLCWIGNLSQEAQNRLVDEGHHPPTSGAAGETELDSGEAGKPLELTLSSKPSNDIQTNHGERKIVTSAVFCEEFEDLVTIASRAISALTGSVGIENSSQDLSRDALKFLRRFWHTVLRKDQILLKSTAAHDEPQWTCNRGSRQLIARCVVQLAMEVDNECCRKLSVQQGLFEKTDFNQKLFFEKYWEQTPVVLSRKLPSCLSALSQTFTTLAALVNNFLAWFVACPRSDADQLHTRCFLESIESNLGEPLIYGQDIRLVKTVFLDSDAVPPVTKGPQKTVEMHYNGKGAASDGQVPQYVHPREILEAVGKEYTVAIKGLELRCSSIADIADCLARQCGQPSVGVNLYITPPNAQGLDLHYDDHCVFVCQLAGRKTWTVFPPQKLLPRLYSCRTLNHGTVTNLAPTVYKLEDGDVLYIPRGFPHNAHCEQPEGISGTGLPPPFRDNTTAEPKCFSSLEEHLNDMPDDVQDLEDNTAKDKVENSQFGTDQNGSLLDNCSLGRYSLHLTVGVEVEPPFEWEGLVHIALRLWVEHRWQLQATSKQSDSYSTKGSYNQHEQFCEALLHTAVNLLGEKEVLLRKACMIAAETLHPQQSSSGLKEEVVASPEANVFVCEQGDSFVCDVCDPVSLEYFRNLLQLVAHRANYKEAYGFAESVSSKCSGSCTGELEWLQHMPRAGGLSTTSFSEPISSAMSKIQSDKFHGVTMSEVEVHFANMKAEFGNALLFHQASEAFRSVHRQYRITRKKLTDGMLALHEPC